MGWHVVSAFHNVVVVWFVLLHQMVKYFFHVLTHVRVCVFIDAQGTGSVLYEEVKQPCFGKWLWQMVQYFAGYEMASAMFCRECEFYLLYHTVFLNIQYCFEVVYFIVVQK